MRFSQKAGWAIVLGILTALTAIGIRSTGPAGADWTIDNGGKALVIRELARSGDPWIRYPAKRIDPQFQFFPQPLEGRERYAVVREGRIHSQYDSPFTRALAPLYEKGELAVSLLPALGGGAAVLVTGLFSIAAAVILLAATPLLFYSSVLWEHTLVIALAAGALLLLARPILARPTARWAFVAGSLMGLAVLLREEIVLLLIAGVAAIAVVRRNAREALAFAGGGALGIAALALFHDRATGSWAGTHVEANRPVLLAHAFDAVKGLLFSPGLSSIPLAVPMLAFVVLVASRAATFRGRDGVENAALAVIAGIAALAFVRYPAGQDHALALIHSNSMLVAMPWALPALASFPSGRERLPFLASVIFLLLFVASVPARSITGIHPGPRMLLPIAPILAMVLAGQIRRDLDRQTPAGRAHLFLLFILLGIGAAWSARSLALLADKREAMSGIAQALTNDPRRIVATDLFWLPTELPSLWDAKQFHLVSGPAELRELQMRYANEGEAEILFVTTAGTIRDRAPLLTVESAGFPHFSVELHPLRR